MKHEKKNMLGIYFFFFLVCSPAILGNSANGTSTDGLIYSSDNAPGNIVERQVNSTIGADQAYDAILFSWGSLLTNATGVIEISTAGIGVSAVGDVLVMTMGPELEDQVAVVEEEQVIIPVVIPETEESSVPSSGGGGGGSSSRDTYGLVVGDKVTVLINEEEHTIEVTEVKESSAVLTVMSTAIIVELEVGETKEIDFDQDEKNDMAITLDAVSELRKITMTIEDITMKEEVDSEESKEESMLAEPLERITGAVVGIDIDADKIKEVKEEVQQTTSAVIKYVLFINIVVGMILGTVIAAREMHRRKIYKFFHQKSKEDIVQDKLKELEKYVNHAHGKGLSLDEIKKVLLEIGWYEYEIDEVITNVMLKKEESLEIKESLWKI